MGAACLVQDIHLPLTPPPYRDSEWVPKITHELFDSIMREVVEEVNIPVSALGAPQFMGVVRNLTTSGRSSMAFQGSQLPV